MIDEFVGNKDIVKIIGDWLSVYYEDKNKASNNYAILFGYSGNGKTFLVSLLAKEYRVELFHVTPEDVSSEQDAYNIYKSVNMKTLDNTNYKLILVDDIDEMPKEYQQIIFDIGKISIYPVIYTSKSYSLSKEFLDGSLKKIVIGNKGNVRKSELLKLTKPLTSILEEHLRKKADEIGITITDEVLHDIALNSKSVRSAELSLYNQMVNEILNPEKTRYELLRSISTRKLQEPLTRININYIFKSIQGYDDDAFRVMLKFAEFEYRIRVKNEEIDPIFVNEMTEKIQNVKFEHEYENNNNHKTPKHELEKPQNVEQKVQQKKVPTVDEWFL
jgi:chromosomal replication initiation ATPase DnaA